MKDGAKLFLQHYTLRKYFFLLRDDIQTIESPNCWDLIGGGIEHGETPDQAMLREYLEETDGLIIGDIKKVIQYSPNGHTIHVYKALTNTKPENIKVCEGQRGRFFSLDEALGLEERIPFLRRFIREHREYL